MPSLIPGYEYDIFISYRQKDNKGEKWVSEFVSALKDELESTFKEEISVYFDINPHDGLLETHDVDSSLREKLKCLVFIPVLSRTYCDPKSFAWRNEFEAFVELATQDQFGLKIKLPNGNIANRVLPVCIHDLDINDIKLYESIIGEVFRDIEFIYKSNGVNRPLRAKEDSPGDNLNKTLYRDQMNLLALAIKEIILGLKGEPDMSVAKSPEHREHEREFYEAKKPSKSSKQKMLVGACILAISIITGIFAYLKISKTYSLERLISKEGKIPITVMPFQNMTGDTTLNIYQQLIQNNLFSDLSNSNELNVRQLETINGMLQNEGLTDYASLTPSIADLISKKLKANVYIQGSIKMSGSTLRLNAQLFDVKTNKNFKSFQIDGTADSSIFPIIDSLSKMVKKFFLLSMLRKQLNPVVIDYGCSNAEAYQYYLYGQNAFRKQDMRRALYWYLKGIAIDSNFINLASQITFAYSNLPGMSDSAKYWCLRYYKKKDQMPMFWRAWMDYKYSVYFETPYEQIKYQRLIINEFDDWEPSFYFNIGWAYQDLNQHEKAIPEMEKVLKLDIKLYSKPWIVWEYYHLGRAYHATGQLRKERKLYKESEQYFPDDPLVIYRQAVLALSKGKTEEADEYIEKYISVQRDNSISEALITLNMARIYAESGILDEAEKYYRQFLSTGPDKPVRMYYLASFLIENNLNISEGLDLIEKALESEPDNYLYLDCKGWGLFTQGKYPEALGILKKADSLKSGYNHKIYLHLEAAKKAVANLK